MFVVFHQLSLPCMFAVVLALSLAVCWLLIGLVRVLVPLLGFWPEDPLPIRDSLINACGGLFALIAAFSAAGIWADAASARNAVAREADAVENAMVLSASLPPDVRSVVEDGVRAYVRDVLAIDWPAMSEAVPFDDPVYDAAEKHLLRAIDLVSRQNQSLAHTTILNQLLDVRHARIARIAASNAGMTWAQWVALWVISTATLLAIAICNSHSFRMQIVATHVYVLVVSAAYFAILAHDRPFVGKISILPTAMQSLLPRQGGQEARSALDAPSGHLSVKPAD